MKKIYLLPLWLIFFVPLIVFEKALILNGDFKNFWIGGVNFDYFSYYKSKILLVLVLLGLISLLYRLRKDEVNIKPLKIFIPIFIYMLFIIISTFMSKYKEVALWGFPDRYEGGIILISYIIIFFIFMFIPNKDDNKLLFNAFILSSIIIGLISVLQFFNLDFIKLYITSKLHSFQLEYLGKIYIDFKPGPRNVYATLYNSNYVGSYMAIAFTISFIIYVLTEGKNKILYGIISSLMYFSLIACHSRAGILGVLVSLILFFIAKFKDVLKNIKYITAILFVYIGIYMFINTLSTNYIGDKLGSLFVDINKSFSQNIDIKIRDIQTADNKVIIFFKESTLTFILENQKIYAIDENNKKVEFDFDSDKKQFIFKDSRFNSLSYYINHYNNMPVIILNNGNESLNLIYTQNQFKILTFNGNIIDIKPVEKIDLNGKERLGSGRGYIWSRSIPLIKNTIFKGFGPDTYAMFFPQHDYIGKFIYLSTPYILVDKPHNMYVQNILNIGLVGTIALLAFLLIFLTSNIKNIIGHRYTENSLITTSIYFAVIAYLVAGLFNDSVVYVAPVFWALLGMHFNLRNE